MKVLRQALIHAGEIRRITDPLSGSCQIPGHGSWMNTVMLKNSVVQGRRGKGKLPGERAQRSRERKII